jgi:hypothetical protein
MDEATELFLRFDYGETRDLLKAFVTLISGSIVLSISFHDRVVTAAAGPRARRLMLWTWSLMFLALVTAGTALALSAAAAACVLYGPAAFPLVTCSAYGLGYGAWALILLAGTLFVASFGTMILAARLSLLGAPER